MVVAACRCAKSTGGAARQEDVMRDRRFAAAGAFALILALIGSAAVTVNGQVQSAAAQKSGGTAVRPQETPPAKIPRTLDGKPDFSGIWAGFFGVPKERPAGVPEFISRDEQLKLLKKDQKQKIDQRVYSTSSVNERIESHTFSDAGKTKTPDSYNTFWRDGYWENWDEIITLPKYRTWQVVDPLDGKVPALTPRAQALLSARRSRFSRPPEGPEDMPMYSGRCVRAIESGPPLMASSLSHYNNDMHIVQGPETFALIQEMIHETQIVPLDGSGHPPAAIRLTKGDSRGHWEGDTLVVDTANFIDATLYYSGPQTVGAVGSVGGTSSEKLHVVERYTQLDGNNIQYRATVDDPDTYVKPYTVEFILYRLRNQKQLVEYACHEGNRALMNILAGARALEAKGIKDPAYFAGAEDEEKPNK
jgi:hypothetical protein